MVAGTLRALGQSTLNLLADTGAMWRLAVDATSRFVLSPLLGRPVRLRATMVQALRSGLASLPLVTLVCFLVGMIIALQTAYQLRAFEAVELVADLEHRR